MARDGLIVAGGRSTRFGGTEKALAECGGTPLVCRVADALAGAVDRLVVNCRPDQADAFERALDGHDVRFALDDDPDRGPLAGLGRGLTRVDTSRVAVAACDMPLLSPALFETLFGALRTDAVVPVLNGRRQPLCAVYRVEPARATCDATLAGGSRRMYDFLDRLETERIAAERLPGADPLRNVNTRAELADAADELPGADTSATDDADGAPSIRPATSAKGTPDNY